jgi:hypothetical protein
MAFPVLEIIKYGISLTMIKEPANVVNMGQSEVYRMVGKGSPRKIAINQYDIIYKTKDGMISKTISAPVGINEEKINVSYWEAFPNIILIDVEPPKLLYFVIILIGMIGILRTRLVGNRSRELKVERKKRKY